MSSDRADALSQIAAEIAACTRCGLHAGRTKTVPGAGSPNAEIMFIGEGPGFNEDRQGLPFVGASGNYLEKLLALIGLKRDDVFIANVVKCRPPDNRDPLPAEIDACKPYLDRQTALIDPLIVVTLGRFSMARYFPGGRITQIHGKPKYDEQRAYYPLFHPAAVLRNPNLQSEMEADFRRIPEILAAVRAKRAPALSSPPADDPPPGGDTPPRQLKLF